MKETDKETKEGCCTSLDGHKFARCVKDKKTVCACLQTNLENNVLKVIVKQLITKSLSL